MFFDDPEDVALSLIKDESDFGRFEKTDKYKHWKRVRDFFLWIVQWSVMFIVVVLGYEIIHDYNVRKKVVDLLIQNIAGLFYSAMTIAGITIANKKDN